MPDITKGDRVRVTRPLSQKHDGKTGTVRWVQSHKGQRAYGVELDEEGSGRTFFPHELEKISE